MHGPPEVGDLEVTLHVEEEVLGLDVPVDHVHGVAVGQGLGHLSDVLAGGRFIKLSSRPLLESLVHFSSRGELQHEVDPRLVPEVSEQSENVVVPAGLG